VAIDTAAKRSAAILHRGVVQPDGTLNAANRASLAFVYFEVPAVLPVFRPGPLSGCVLGYGETEVYLMDFCGKSVLFDLTDAFSFLKYARELDDDSETEISLHMTGDSVGDACCEVLANTRTWRHEILVVRNGEPIWGPGPLITITIQREIAHLVARDIVAWLDVRAIHTDYDFHQTDLTTIAETVIVDALTMGPAASIPAATRDACILDLATFTPTNKFTDLQVVANQQTAGEVLRSLAGQGLDFTVINRSLVVGADFAWGPVGPLRDEDFLVDLEVTEHGLSAATQVYLTGATDVHGECGGVDPYFGLIEQAIEGQATTATQADLDRLACERVAALNPPPLTINVPAGATISPAAPLCGANLVPGTMVDLDIQDLCRPALVRQRINAVEFRLDDNGEQVGVTIAPMGDPALADQTQ
jgi:hypothetical protein